MSGKKGKKTKTKTIPLQDFLGDSQGTAPAAPKIKSWADSIDDDDDYAYSTRSKEPIVLPTAPRAARDQSIDEENIPTNPPYVAYISNLPYEVYEEDLHEFFQDMKVSSMRLPKESNKFKGYGYVEFEDRQSLIDALSMIDTNLKGRAVRIELSNNTNEDRRGRMGRMGDQRQYYGDDPERLTGDWRGARTTDGPEEGGREDRYRNRGGGGGFSRDDRDSGFEDNKPGNWRDGPRDMTSLDSRPRPTFRDNRADDRGGERDWNRFGDRSRSNRDGSRERDGGDRGSSFGPRRHYGDDMNKEKERWGNVRSMPRENVEGPPAEPRTRPKLDLKPRSKPIETVVEPKGDAASKSDENDESTPAPVSANIFGAAKPVDTAAREREIEERLAKSKAANTDTDRRGREGGSVWGRRNGEGREEPERSRPAWRSNDERSQFDRFGSRPQIVRSEQRDFRDHREQRDSKDPRESRDSKDLRDVREPRESGGDTRGPPVPRSAPSLTRGPPKQIDSRPPPDGAEIEKKKEEEELNRMPKAKDDQAPNFVASNKYSMLPDDIDPDILEE